MASSINNHHLYQLGQLASSPGNMAYCCRELVIRHTARTYITRLTATGHNGRHNGFCSSVV